MSWSDHSGFTLVELTLAMLSAAILAALAGIMLYYGYVAWRNDNATVGLQRDRTVAVTAMNHVLRQASGSNVTAGASSPQLTVQLTNQTARFYTSGSNLIFDPNINVGGDAVTLVSGRLVTFAATKANLTNQVKVTLVLRDSDGTLNSNDTFTTFRN